MSSYKVIIRNYKKVYDHIPEEDGAVFVFHLSWVLLGVDVDYVVRGNVACCFIEILVIAGVFQMALCG